MNMTIEAYAKNLQNDFFDNELNNAMEFITDVYGEYLVFYPRNAVNKAEDELFFIYENKIVVLKLNNYQSEFEVVEYPKEIIKKRITVSLKHEGITMLYVKLKSDKIFNFNSLEDSNTAWENKYAKLIQELYKFI